MTARQHLAAMGAALVLLFMGVNLLGQSLLSGLRIDFTEARLYALSDGTRATLSRLSEPIEVTLVYTRDAGRTVPAIQAYANRVREVLQSYEVLSRGMIRLRILDPRPFSEDEDAALANGLRVLSTGGPDPIYFGLIARNSVDQTRVIPFLSPDQETRLEYELTRLLQRLDQPRVPRLAILSALPGIDAVTPEAGYALLRDLEASYSIDRLTPDFATLPDDIDVLFMVHPPPLDAWQLWQIDQYILSGGKALILLDPAAKTAPGTGPFGLGDRQIRSDLGPLMQAWGVQLDSAALADSLTALPIEIESESGRTEIVAHPLFMSIPADLMDPDSLIVAGLSRGINLAAAGRFIIDPQAPGHHQVLMQSGPAPSPVDPARAALDLSAAQTLALYEAGDAPAILAVRLSGSLDSAFPDGPPQARLPDDPLDREWVLAAQQEAGPGLTRSTGAADIILVADADLVEDSLYLTPGDQADFADNGVFLLNALDSLTGGTELMGLRARVPGHRPMARLDRMRAAAQQAVQTERSALQARLDLAQAQLDDLQALLARQTVRQGSGPSAPAGTEEAERIRLTEDILSTREALRGIERRYRADIDRLENGLRAFTLGTGPLLMLALAGLLYRQRRRRG